MKPFSSTIINLNAFFLDTHMLLQQLKLQNIRSYSSETINFPEGSILLSGDIGSGKSTILLAIEFALFGTSRPDLPAEALLRKGATQGYVELTFQLENNEIIIKRSLKKDNDGIKQTAGHIIINNNKKDLTSQELKAEILNLLGYPEEYLTKNKNYLFRYTVYTPQEEMKLILQEDADIRLDTLRKIFNLDKYKNIRENIATYLKQYRSQITILSAKVEPLEQQQQKILLFQQEMLTLQESQQLLLPKLLHQQQQWQQQQQELETLEQKQKEFLELKQQIHTHTLILQEKNSQQQLFSKKEKQLQEQIQQLSIPQNLNSEQVQKEISKLEEEKNLLLTSQTQIKERLQQSQHQLAQLQTEVTILENSLRTLPQKEQDIAKIIPALQQKEALNSKKQQLEDLLLKTNELIVKNETLLHQSRDVQEKIKTLDNCPTCLQKVTPEHRHSIVSKEENKIKTAEGLLFDLKKKKLQIQEQRQEAFNHLELLFSQENLLTRLRAEMSSLQEKKVLLQQKKQLLYELEQKLPLLQQQSTSIDSLKISNLQQELSQQRELLNNCFKQQYFTQQLQETQKQLQSLQENITITSNQREALQKQLQEKIDFSLTISEKKILMTALQEEEKHLLIQRTQILSKIDHLSQQEKELKEIISALQEEKNKLMRWKELYHWLEEHFLPLTCTLEKQVMISIHRQFNQLFQEWFSTLIDNENITARLDESFTPLIEQNGYDIAFSNLSGGEKTSAALSYRLALNRVINDIIHEIKTKNLLILDEPTDGFSSEQLDKVREVLEKLNIQQTIIVSHESKIESFVNNILRISKNDAESRVVS